MAFNSVSGTSNSSVSKGIGGLVSGLETDELVKGMTADIQNKIDKQLQEKQKIEWQQETYRSLTKAMSEFNNKYFSSTSMTNITDPSFFSSYILNNPDISSKYVSLSGSIEKANNVKVNQISQLAEKAKYDNNIDVSGRMTGVLDTANIKKLSGSTLTFYLDGITKDVTLNDIGNSNDLETQLNNKLGEAFGTRATNIYKKTDNHYVVKENNKYYKANEDGTYINDSSGNPEEDTTITDTNQLTQIFQNAVQVSTDGDALQFKLADKSSTFALHTASAATLLGVDKGALKVEAGTSGTKLEIGLGGVTALSGAKLDFTIDGVKKTVDLGDDITIDNLGTILSRRFTDLGITGVTVSVDRTNRKLTIDGGTKTISIDGASGGQYTDTVVLGKETNGILDELHNNNSKNVTTSLNPPQPSNSDLSKDQLAQNLSGLELNFTISHEEEDGSTVTKSKTIRLGTVESMEDLENQLNEKLKNAFGKDTVKAEVDENGKISFTSEKETIKIQTFQADVFSNDIEGIIGINAGTSSKLNLNMSLSEIVDGYGKVENAKDRKLTINGVDIEVELHDTLSTIMQKVNHSGAGVTMTYSPMTGKVMMESNNTGALEKIEFGAAERDDSVLEKILFDVDNYAAHHKDGKNSRAELIIDGTTMIVERPSNNISIDGMNMTLKELYNTDTASPLDPLTFNVTTDTDKVVENIKGFVEAYNAIVKGISDEINTRHDRKYPPLTDAQREEMSDKQIEKWEEKAREGLLYRDTALNGVLSQMRLSLYQSVDGVDGFITDCGISTGDYADNGQLKIDETKLRKVLTENPSMVADLFTKQSDIDFIAEPTTPADTEDMATRKKESGLMVRFQDILQRAVGTGSVKGTLLQMAGLEGDRTDEDNTLTTKMEDIDKKVKDLKKELASAQERYWSQFTALEKYINQMNQQSSALLGQFGYSQ